jgi:hypothetical protein
MLDLPGHAIEPVRQIRTAIGTIEVPKLAAKSPCVTSCFGLTAICNAPTLIARPALSVEARVTAVWKWLAAPQGLPIFRGNSRGTLSDE